MTTTTIVDVSSAIALDRSVHKIQKAAATGSVSDWTIGKELNVIHFDKLWKLRRDVNGNQVYRSFASFCDVELDMTYGTAFGYMDIAAAFDEEDVRKYGTSKLVALLRAPEQAKASMRRMIERGASQRQLKAALRLAKEEYGVIEKRVTGRKQVGGRLQATMRVRPVQQALLPLVGAHLNFVAQKSMGSRRVRFAKRLADAPIAELKIGRVTMVLKLSSDKKGRIVGDISLVR